MEEALAAHLLATAGLTALVGNRVNWNARPQASATPSVVLTRVGGTPDYTMAGASGLVETRVQIDAWGKTYSSAIGVSRAVKTVLSGFSATVGAIMFQGSFLESERQSFEQGSGGEEFHRVSLDFIIWHKET
ncbi:DUF3168 domain-containing protein [Aurantimonas endophytica]|uniref:DUF3168 domain-containing protein n=1 Tax=Aurantimonas endophytica TaxID=1522175 RepID=A0A7W6MN83_9HYPH|nr:DUF3168 domain-containing protein [Aurantimonas endophytica]MBB4001592.1 hypothetical protein [Aurantimonas endophytica]MCO6402768.1 DUF3168 domain-containing protein [Aurantimonas endophytica]